MTIDDEKTQELRWNRNEAQYLKLSSGDFAKVVGTANIAIISNGIFSKDPNLCIQNNKIMQNHYENSMDGRYIYVYINNTLNYFVYLRKNEGKKHTRRRRILRKKASRYYSLELCAVLHVFATYMWYTHHILKDNTDIFEMILGMF